MTYHLIFWRIKIHKLSLILFHQASFYQIIIEQLVVKFKKKASTKTLKTNIINIAKKDIDGITATFDGWTNIKAEYI